MTEYFEANGLWHLPDTPDVIVPGTLKYDADGITLVLTGGLTQALSDKLGDYPLILGRTGSNPHGHGSIVSLIDCFGAGKSINFLGMGTEKIRCNRAALGNFHLSAEPFEYEYLELGINHLADWATLGGLEWSRVPGDPATYSATYRKPPEVRGQLGDREIVLETVCRMPHSANRMSFEMDRRLLIKPLGEISPDDLGEDHVRTWQDFLTFATDRPVGVAKITYAAVDAGHGFRPKIDLIYNPIFRPVAEPKSIHVMEMLFGIDDARALGLDIFAEWGRFYESHPEFVALYFGYRYSQPKYLDDKFAKVAAALKLLCSDLDIIPKKAKSCLDDFRRVVDDHFPDDQRLLVEQALPAASDLGLLPAMKGLLAEHAPIMGKIVRDVNAFLRDVATILVFVRRREERADVAPLEGATMHWHKERIDTLIKVMVLKELSFPPEVIATLMDRNATFNHLARS